MRIHVLSYVQFLVTLNCLLKGFAMPPTPFLGSGASFQGLGPLPMASARRAIGFPLIESFWRAIGVEIK